MQFGMRMEGSNRSAQQNLKILEFLLKAFPLPLEKQPGQSSCTYLIPNLDKMLIPYSLEANKRHYTN